MLWRIKNWNDFKFYLRHIIVVQFIIAQSNVSVQSKELSEIQNHFYALDSQVRSVLLTYFEINSNTDIQNLAEND